MPIKKDKKKKRQPSFTMGKAPHEYGTSRNRASIKKAAGTWTGLKVSGNLRGQRLLNLNNRIAQNLNMQEISQWVHQQKVYLCLYSVTQNCPSLCQAKHAAMVLPLYPIML